MEMDKPPQLLLLEFNEISFENVSYYCARGRLPHLRELIERNGWSTTTSEQNYEHLEPWIQWVTAHTGLTFAEHGVFRLGDIINHDLPQIWELLEERGLKVGAISPMNAKYRLRDPAFFVPDPWTPTTVAAPPRLRRLYDAIAQAVNDNAQSKLTLRSAYALLSGLLGYARVANYGRYVSLAAQALTRPWKRALTLDLLLADVFVDQVRRTRPHFASLFLNAGAHIQHHYMFSAKCYSGAQRNPAWYAPQGADPVLEAYEIYDAILGAVRGAFPQARLMLATGLHQVPHPEVTYYWRLRDHEAFLRSIGVQFSGVQPRMSRDFLITCASAEQAQRAAQRLQQAVAADGRALFEVDNRGTDLFVMLVYPGDIGAGFRFTIGADEYADLREHVVFVAIKNGEHDGIGYFIDSAAVRGSTSAQFPLTDVPGRIMHALGVYNTPGRAAQ